MGSPESGSLLSGQSEHHRGQFKVTAWSWGQSWVIRQKALATPGRNTWEGCQQDHIEDPTLPRALVTVGRVSYPGRGREEVT